MESQAVSDRAYFLMQQSNAFNTRRAYASMLQGFDAWRRDRLVDDGSIADYLAHLQESGKAVATARIALAAVRYRARHNDEPSPDGALTAKVLAGYGRAGANRGRGQVTGVTWEQADAMASLAAQGGCLWGLRDAALIAVMSDALLRVSEAAAVGVADVNPAHNGAGTLLVARSKTDSEARGTVLHLRAVTLRRISSWKETAGIESGPLFRRIRKGGRVEATAPTVQSIRAIIQRWAKAAGLSGRVSGHSLRVGAAQSLVSAGATLPELQQAGRWLSPSMPAYYARAQLAGQSAVARLRPDARENSMGAGFAENPAREKT